MDYPIPVVSLVIVVSAILVYHVDKQTHTDM